MKHHYMLAIAISTLVAGQALATETAMQSPQASRLKGTLTVAERGQIAKVLAHRFAPQAPTKDGNVAGWARKFGRLIGTADATNVQNAMNMPTLNTATAVLLGQSVDSSSIQTALKESISGNAGPALLGDALKDTVYTPLPAGRCRVADSRVINNPLPGSAYRTIRVEGQDSFSTQGGDGSANGNGSANCGIPNDVNAYAISVTILTNGQEGYFKIFRYAATTYREGNTIYYTPAVSAANDVIVKSCITCTSELEIYSSSSVHYVIDVVGYFIKPEATTLECVQGVMKTITIPANSSKFEDNQACPDQYRATTPYCWSYTPGVYSQGSGLNSNNPSATATTFCAWQNTTAAPQTVRGANMCCRVPGR